MQIYIGVVWYKNTAEERSLWLRNALNAIEKAPQGFSFSIVEIDNSEDADDSTANEQTINERVSSVVHRPCGNIGFGAAHNKLMNRSFKENAAFYIGANPDGRFHRFSLLKLLSKVLVQPKNLYELRQFPTEHPKYYAPDTGETLWASGAAFCLSKESWETIGDFDDRFFMYCEDVDLSWRFRMAGRSCITVGDSLYYHNTANRKVSLAVEQRFLLSGRILGLKYGISELVDRCEDALKARGVPIPGNHVESILSSAEIIRFKNEVYYGDDFSFSPVRWNA